MLSSYSILNDDVLTVESLDAAKTENPAVRVNTAAKMAVTIFFISFLFYLYFRIILKYIKMKWS